MADPSTLADQFALVASGQIRHPGQVIMLLGPAAAQDLPSDQTVPGVPAANVSVPTQQESGVSPAVQILVVEVLGLAFIGLLSVASFSVLAQRRLRALGMLGAIGATERNLRLVMIAGGLVVGATAALAGTVLGLAAWIAYAPTVQRDTGHAVDAAHLPWWAFAIGIVLAIATSALASRRPAKTMAAVPVVTALSGRPAPPKAAHRSALPGVIVLAVGLACLASAGGLNGLAGGNGPRQQRRGQRARRCSCWAAWSPPSPGSACSPRWPSACWQPGRPRDCRSRSGSRCATWCATAPGPVPRWRRPRSPCSWPWGSASSPASSSTVR